MQSLQTIQLLKLMNGNNKPSTSSNNGMSTTMIDYKREGFGKNGYYLVLYAAWDLKGMR